MEMIDLQRRLGLLSHAGAISARDHIVAAVALALTVTVMALQDDILEIDEAIPGLEVPPKLEIPPKGDEEPPCPRR